MPRLSVIVPVYNARAYLDECVQGIIRQTIADWELILVDDASTDDSLQICQRYATQDQRIRVLSDGGCGVSAARNMGVAASCGDFLMFCDADDVYHPQALEELSRILEHNPDVDIAVAGFSQNPAIIDRAVCPRWRIYDWAEALGRTLYQNHGFHESAWAKAYRRSILSTDPFADGRRYEDLEAVARLYPRADKIAVTNAVLYYYRRNTESFINTWSNARCDALWAVDSILKNVSALNRPDIERAASSRRFSAYYNILNLALANNLPKLASSCRKEVRRAATSILKDKRTRLKNKVGALVAILGLR